MNSEKKQNYFHILNPHHDKDFLKLKEEGSADTLTYFLEIVKSSNSGTSNSIQDKKKNFGGVFKCWSCSKGGYLI